MAFVDAICVKILDETRLIYGKVVEIKLKINY